MTSKTLELNPMHPLAFELSSLRLADEAYTTSVKLQRYSLESANAHDRAVYLERENEVLRTELAILRAHPHPEALPQAHPAVAQVQQLTLSLRKLSDKLSLTEAALLERTTQLSHVTAEASHAKLTAEAAYDLAARTRGREEAGLSRELELEHKVKAAEEAVKMSDLVVNEYADLVRSLQTDKSHERLVDGLAEGKLGLQQLLNEFNAETARLQKELLDVQGALAATDSQRNSEKLHLENCRNELAQARFELQKLKIDDNTAAKMVSRYMNFSQTSTNTLFEALSSLKTRHSATTSTLSSQLLSLRSQLRASSTQTETLRRALDELGGELAKEAFGRRREVALRIQMVNREEKIHRELERWVIKAEEAGERARAEGGVDDGNLRKMVSAARAVLQRSFGGEDGKVGRVVVAEAAVKELQMELEREMGRRLELEMAFALRKTQEAAAASGSGDENGGQILEKPEKQLVAIPPAQANSADFTMEAPSPKTSLLVAETESSPRRTPDDSAPLTSFTTTNGTHEPSLEQPSTTLLTSVDTLNNKDEQFPPPSLTDSQFSSIPTQNSSEVNSADIPVKEYISAPATEMSLLIIAEAQSTQKPVSEDSTPIINTTIVNGTRESPLDPESPSPPMSIPNDEEEKVLLSMPTDLPNRISTNETEVPALFIECPNDLEVLTHTAIEHSTYQQDLALTTDEKTTSEEDPSTVEYDAIPQHTITKPKNDNTSGLTISLDDYSSEVDFVLPEGEQPQHTQLDSIAIIISSDKPRSTDYDSNLDTEHESPPAFLPLHDGSSSTISRLWDTSSASHALLSPTISPSLGPLPSSVDNPSPHPLLADLAKTKHRYDTLQRSFRDCHLALESLTASLESTATGRVPAEALRTAVQRLNDYTEDARVELEIQIADEEIVGRGFEMMLCVPGALAMPTPHTRLSSEQEHEQDMMMHSDIEKQVEAFVSGTDTSVNKAVQSLSHKLEDIEHDIAALKRAVHDVNDTSSPPSPITSTNTHKGGSGGWTSWIPGSPIPSPSASLSNLPFPISVPGLGPTPTFRSAIFSPRLRHSPSLEYPGVADGKRIDPLASLELRVPMPSYIQHQAPTMVQPRPRTLSTMYMLGFGSRSVSGSGNRIFGDQTSPKKGEPVPETWYESEDKSDESDESDVE
ncbi:hypothetical protein E4T56_gene9999 [Termitomyces sp. T112]|nr:hypothetical protein E4T56_gene9999 [Termitomyces sp. T112]